MSNQDDDYFDFLRKMQEEDEVQPYEATPILGKGDSQDGETDNRLEYTNNEILNGEPEEAESQL